MKFFQSASRLESNRERDKQRKRLDRFNRRINKEKLLYASIKANEQISLDYSLRYSNGL